MALPRSFLLGSSPFITSLFFFSHRQTHSFSLFLSLLHRHGFCFSRQEGKTLSSIFFSGFVFSRVRDWLWNFCRFWFRLRTARSRWRRWSPSMFCAEPELMSLWLLWRSSWGLRLVTGLRSSLMLWFRIVAGAPSISLLCLWVNQSLVSEFMNRWMYECSYLWIASSNLAAFVFWVLKHLIEKKDESEYSTVNPSVNSRKEVCLFEAAVFS